MKVKDIFIVNEKYLAVELESLVLSEEIFDAKIVQGTEVLSKEYNFVMDEKNFHLFQKGTNVLGKGKNVTLYFRFDPSLPDIFVPHACFENTFSIRDGVELRLTGENQHGKSFLSVLPLQKPIMWFSESTSSPRRNAETPRGKSKGYYSQILKKFVE
jgi:hypothetical protein